MDKSLNNVSNNVQALTLDTVYLGADRTFSNADFGTGGISSWGVAPVWYGWDPYLSSRRGEAGSLAGPGGYGGVGAWVQVGKTFTVSGSGSRSANIRMSGHMYGLTTAFAGGSSNSVVNLVVKDATTGTTYSTNIYNQGAGGAGWYEVNQDFNNGINVNLQSSHSYIIYLELQTSGAVYGAGEAGSDFGRYDGDYAGEGVWYNNIIVDF